MRVEMDSAPFVTVCSYLYDVNHDVVDTVDRLSSSLDACGAMAGDDTCGEAWAAQYDPAAAKAVQARAVDLELAPPQPSVARSLRLLPGQSATSVTIRFDDQASGSPVGLTTVTLKPHHFRVVIQAGDQLPTVPHLAD